MEGFVEGYMKMHTTSSGKRRWSRKASLFQNIREEDLERLRMNMGSGVGGEKNKEPLENESKERKDSRPATSASTSSIFKDEAKETEDSILKKPTADAKVDEDNK